jgi:Endosomal/lysosomal potassium channel TMEM175
MGDRAPYRFEMRRLASLSNTIFGVAMTLLAYDLPRMAQLTGPPTWAELYHLYAARLTAMVLSFVIAGIFWFSHHRRLARQPDAGRTVVFINLVFLLSIILLPATNALYGSYGQSSVVAVLYGLHLTVICGAERLALVACDPQPALRRRARGRAVLAHGVRARHGAGERRPAIRPISLAARLRRTAGATADRRPHRRVSPRAQVSFGRVTPAASVRAIASPGR